jgi:hypothetical protein
MGNISGRLTGCRCWRTVRRLIVVEVVDMRVSLGMLVLLLRILCYGPDRKGIVSRGVVLTTIDGRSHVGHVSGDRRDRNIVLY